MAAAEAVAEGLNLGESLVGLCCCGETVREEEKLLGVP
jgi:hypothetical protein